MLRAVGGSVQAPMARALVLRGFRRAPVVRSYSRIAIHCVEVPRVCEKDRHIVGISNDGPVLRLSSLLGRLSSSARIRGCRHKAKRPH